MELSTTLIEQDGPSPEAFRLRARAREALSQFDRAVADLDRAIELAPNEPDGCQARGQVQFKAGKVRASVDDFDRFLQLRPERKPHHWQRGISYYYAGEYEKGAKQFELHKTVNPEDVENAVWHFLCKARVDGVEKARAEKISETEAQRQRNLFYTHLYVGLYHEAMGRADQARKHIRIAVKKYPSPHYMGDVARVHVQLVYSPRSTSSASPGTREK